jgi:Ser/Thr protein kinase RdoA (MazF antagonist)
MHDAVQALRVWMDHGELEVLAGGLINQTWLVSQEGRRVGVLQALNTRIFVPEVHFDIEAVTQHLLAAGVASPRILRTRTGALWHVADSGMVFRLLSFEGERTIDRVEESKDAHSAGRLIGRFHQALADLDWEFRCVRPGAHDTARHLSVLSVAVREHAQHRLFDDVAPLAAEIAERWIRWSGPSALPRRVIHGDLKISNLRFSGDMATHVVDLDTMQFGTIDAELGDAMRSWCNPTSEDDASSRWDVDIFAAAMHGYAETGRLTDAEWASIVPGTERICLELAARFAADALNESYFGWNQRFGTRGEHNLLRARGQLALARSVSDQRALAERVIGGLRDQFE